MDARSGCVKTRVRSGLRWVWRVRVRPRPVVKMFKRVEAREGGRKRGMRVR